MAPKMIVHAGLALALLGGSAGPAPVTGHQACTRPGTLVITLGTAGGPRPRADRAQSANLLIAGGEPYLVDAGENVVRRLGQAGVDFARVGHLFLTHGHSDHSMGLPALIATQWEFQRREPLEIYGPPGTAELVAGALAFLSANERIRATEGNPGSIARQVKVADVSPGLVYRDRNVTVTAVENTHFHFPPGSPAHGRFGSFSYRFETADRVVVFTGDSGPSAALAELAKDADVLVTEASSAEGLLALYRRNGSWQRKSPAEQADWLRHQREEHLSPADIGALAARAGVKKIVLTHLTPTDGGDAAYRHWVREVRKAFSGKVALAADLACF
jgi:ribonuclease BN (tRNA processing enzyme)